MGTVKSKEKQPDSMTINVMAKSKLESLWGHYVFNYLWAIAACADLLYDRGWKSTPCHKTDDESRMLTYRARLSGWQRALPKDLRQKWAYASEFGRSLPPPLIERPGEFPASWFEHLHTCAAGTPRQNCTREARTRWARTVPGLRPRRRGKNVGK